MFSTALDEFNLYSKNFSSPKIHDAIQSPFMSLSQLYYKGGQSSYLAMEKIQEEENEDYFDECSSDSEEKMTVN